MMWRSKSSGVDTPKMKSKIIIVADLYHNFLEKSKILDRELSLSNFDGSGRSEYLDQQSSNSSFSVFNRDAPCTLSWIEQTGEGKILMDGLIVSHIESHDDPVEYHRGCRDNQIDTELRLC